MKLKTKFSIFSGLLIILVAFSISALLIFVEEKYLTNETKQKQLSSINNLARVAKDSIIREDDLMILNYINTIRKTEGSISYAMVVNNESKIIAHTDTLLLRTAVEDPIGIKAQTCKDIFVQTYKKGNEEIIDVASPVMVGNKKSGIVRLGFSKTIIDNTLKNTLDTIRKHIIVVTIPVVILGLLGALIFVHTMTKPIKALAQGSKLIAEGKLDTKIKTKGKDELGLLAEQFNIMAEKLNELDELKRDFVSCVTHDLRSPLSAIESYVNDMLEGGAREFERNGIENLNIIRNNAVRLSRLIDNLLDAAKLESGRIELDLKLTNIHSVINDVAKLFASYAEDKKITIKSKLSELIPGIVIDGDKIRQVLANLVSNSIKFTPSGVPPGGGTITIVDELITDTEKNQRFVQISVTDTGLGIPAENLDKIFSKFTKVSNTKGTGLGLFISSNIIELHGGKIWVESPVPGSTKGSKFTFTLPVKSNK